MASPSGRRPQLSVDVLCLRLHGLGRAKYEHLSAILGNPSGCWARAFFPTRDIYNPGGYIPGSTIEEPEIGLLEAPQIAQAYCRPDSAGVRAEGFSLLV